MLCRSLSLHTYSHQPDNHSNKNHYVLYYWAKYLLQQLTSDTSDPILAWLAREDMVVSQSLDIACYDYYDDVMTQF